MVPTSGSRNGPTEPEANRASPALIQALTARGHELQLMPRPAACKAFNASSRAATRRGSAVPIRAVTVLCKAAVDDEAHRVRLLAACRKGACQVSALVYDSYCHLMPFVARWGGTGGHLWKA